MMEYSPLYTFLSYLQLSSIVLTFVMLIIGIIGGILGIRALLIYIKKNKPANDAKNTVALEGTAFEAPMDGAAEPAEAAEVFEEVEAEIVTPDFEAGEDSSEKPEA